MFSFVCALLTAVRDRSLFTSESAVGVMLRGFWLYSSSIVILGNYTLASLQINCLRWASGVRWESAGIPMARTAGRSDYGPVDWDYSRSFAVPNRYMIFPSTGTGISPPMSDLLRIDGIWLIHFCYFLYFVRYQVSTKVSRWCAWTYWAMLWNLSTTQRNGANGRSWSGRVPKSSSSSWKSWWVTVSVGSTFICFVNYLPSFFFYLLLYLR